MKLSKNYVRLFVQLLFFAAYIPLFIYFYRPDAAGTGPAILVLIPVFSAAYFYGLRGAMLSAFVSVGLTLGIIHMVKTIPWSEIIYNTLIFWRVPAAFILAYIAGKLVDLNRSLKTEVLHRKQAEAAANKALQVKSNFLATMSHELRTPLNGVIGMSNLLLDTELSSDQKKFVETINYSGENLLGIINEILDYSRLESGKTVLESDPYSIRIIINYVVDLLQGQISSKGLEIRKYISPDVPDLLLGDEARIRQILINLVGNAVKFTKEGSIEINVELVSQVENEYEIEFSVKDTGIGIEESNIEKLFDPFTQADKYITRNFGGTGLGLAISSSLVKLMKGGFRVESIPGQGSTFIFTIRAEKSDAPVKKKVEDNLLDEGLSSRIPLKILIAEDNMVNQQLVMRIFKKMGYRPDMASNGLEVLRKMETGTYDMIFMDIHMPEMDGVTATKEILKKYKSGTEPVIIALTADMIPENQEEFTAAGMKDFIGKPISFMEIQNAIIKWGK